jgi:hypothetical protein
MYLQPAGRRSSEEPKEHLGGRVLRSSQPASQDRPQDGMKGTMTVSWSAHCEEVFAGQQQGILLPLHQILLHLRRNLCILAPFFSAHLQDTFLSLLQRGSGLQLTNQLPMREVLEELGRRSPHRTRPKIGHLNTNIKHWLHPAPTTPRVCPCHFLGSEQTKVPACWQTCKGGLPTEFECSTFVAKSAWKSMVAPVCSKVALQAISAMERVSLHCHAYPKANRPYRMTSTECRQGC